MVLDTFGPCVCGPDPFEAHVHAHLSYGAPRVPVLSYTFQAGTEDTAVIRAGLLIAGWATVMYQREHS